MPDAQRQLQSLLNQFVEEDLERGLQVAVYLHGELIVDACAGVADPATGRKVDSDTLFPIFSTTKGIAATLVHLLVERGKLSYETPIAGVWPEFAAHGKGGITLRHALNHSASLALMPLGVTRADLSDWSTMCAKIAALKPVTPPGAEMAYHAITYGWILGEVARRVDGRSFGQMLREEICLPLGLTRSLFVGIPDDVEPLVAILERKPADASPAMDDSIPQAIPSLLQPLHDWMNRSDARRACIPASNGIMTARAIARHYAALLPGGVDGVELLPPSRIRSALAPQAYANMLPDDPPLNQRLGYTVGHASSLSAFGHNGYGGSVGFADLERGLAFGFARNRFDHEGTLPRILETLREAVR
jgi:CubicO group peptidase (beta-lactamase class C family)